MKNNLRKLFDKMMPGQTKNSCATTSKSAPFYSAPNVSAIDRSHSFSYAFVRKKPNSPSSIVRNSSASASRPPTPAPRALYSTSALARSVSEPNLGQIATSVPASRYLKKGDSKRAQNTQHYCSIPVENYKPIPVLPAAVANRALQNRDMYNTRQDLIQKLLNQSHTDGETSSPCISICSSDDSPPRNSLARHRKWNNTDAFIQDNLGEVYEKLGNLEKQIWGKLIVMEGGRRTAKAYLRHPLITIDGSNNEFDGLRIGLSGFANSERTSLVREIFNEMVEGVKLKIDPDGNVWAKRLCFSPVFLKPLYRNSPNDLFVIDHRPVKVFDIRRFKELLVSELRSGRADRRRLERSCMICIKFSVDHYDLLSTPCWIAIVHLVAIELLNLVLPKDHELSSPSSSFVAGPTGMGHHHARKQHAQPAVMAFPSAPSILTPPRANNRTPKGAVFKRIVRKEDFGHNPTMMNMMADSSYYGSAQAIRSPYNRHQPGGAGGSDFDSVIGGRDAFNSASMLDLRAISAVKSPVYFSRGAENRESTRPSRGGMGQRVLSAEALHVLYPDSVPKAPQPAPRWNNHRQMMRRWKSQDSGMGSGGDSFGSRGEYP